MKIFSNISQGSTGIAAELTNSGGKRTRSSKLSSKLAKSKMIPFARHNRQSISPGYYGGIQRSEEILPDLFLASGTTVRNIGKENRDCPNIDAAYIDSPMSAASSINSIRYESSESGAGDCDGDHIKGAATVLTTSTTSTGKTNTDSDSEM